MRDSDNHDGDGTPIVDRREFLKVSGAVVVSIGVGQHRRGADTRGRRGRAAARAGIGPARSDVARFVSRGPLEQHRQHVSWLRRSRARRTDGAVPDRRRRARSRLQSDLDRPQRHVHVHQRLHRREPHSRHWRSGNACRRRRGAARAAWSGVGATESACAGSDGRQGRGVGEGRARAVGHLRRVAGR